MTTTPLSSGRVARIFLRPCARAAVRKVQRAQAVAGRGLTGDHAGGGRREITILDLAAWRAACAELGVDIDPLARRANLVLEGLALAKRRGRLIVGGCELEVLGELRPCELLDRAHVGLCAALRPQGRGGVHARILASGEVAVGDPARWAN